MVVMWRVAFNIRINQITPGITEGCYCIQNLPKTFRHESAMVASDREARGPHIAWHLGLISSRYVF